MKDGEDAIAALAEGFEVRTLGDVVGEDRTCGRFMLKNMLGAGSLK
jgi:hypothetical protein